MGLLSSILHPSRPYRKAAEQSQMYYDQAQSNLAPYQQQGQAAYGDLQGAMQNMLNPEQMYGDWAQGYEKSPYAQMLQQEAMDQGLGAASSMGLMGSSAALNALQRGTSMIGQQDRDNYLNKLLNMYTNGASTAQNIYSQGASASGQMGQNAMNQGNTMDEQTYGIEQAPAQMMGRILGGGLMSAFPTGSDGQGSGPNGMDLAALGKLLAGVI